MVIAKDLINSILIAKSILDEHPELITSIQFDRQYLGKQPFVINDKVQLHTSIKPLIPIIKQKLRTDAGMENPHIEVYQVDTSADWKKNTRMAGIVAKETENNFVILLNESETYCTQRLSLCKELAQIYVDSLIATPSAKLDAHTKIVEATRELILKFYSSRYSPTFESTEMFAQSIALELMIPYTLRDEIEKFLEMNVEKSFIAKRLFVTQETLDEYLKTYFYITTPIYKML